MTRHHDFTPEGRNTRNYWQDATRFRSATQENIKQFGLRHASHGTRPLGPLQGAKRPLTGDEIDESPPQHWIAVSPDGRIQRDAIYGYCLRARSGDIHRTTFD